jgi:hypothetical protein
LLHCYHVTEEENPTKGNPRNIQTTKIKGEREVECPQLESKYYVAQLNINKVNIGKVENPKIASIGYYWDNQTIERITELLHGYSDLFLATFFTARYQIYKICRTETKC